MAPWQVTLTAADKASIVATLTEKGTEKGMDEKAIKAMVGKVPIPDKIAVGAMF